jgi:DNA-binding response OmpR family regulator
MEQSHQITVLLVDDEQDLLDLLRDFLEVAGFDVKVALSAQEALRILAATTADCVLLDVMLPELSGFDLCRKIREHYDLPILFLSARDTDLDKIRGLGLGGDDYITKSASHWEVVARIKAVMRRYQQGSVASEKAELDFGRLVLDIKAHEVRIDGQPIPFTGREFALLCFLAEHPRQIFTHDQLFEQIWGDVGDRHAVAVHIARIREKIEVHAARPEYIVTVWGVGYRFEGKRR